jgi:1,4-alpha-glucan branching enzyme
MGTPGSLALILHTHMPYVEGGGEWPPADDAAFLRAPAGFGTWPFGEEWLWEVIATSYLPLLEILKDNPPVTLSVTPVLCDQLEAPGAIERCVDFLDEIRPESHRRDIAALKNTDAPELAVELERSAAEYKAAAARLRELLKQPNGLLNALGSHATWTSAATHPILPLIATDAGISLQLQTGIESHRRRFGEWAGGLWLPECAHAPWLDPLLEEPGVRATCVERTNAFGLGDVRHLTPLQTEAGPVLWPIDRATIELVWSDRGYPSAAVYRDYHALTTYHHRPWRNDGGPYDHEQAIALARGHARHFVAHVKRRTADGGVCVCALDTELLGHHWYEGPHWLKAVIEEAAEQDLRLTTLDDALERANPVPAPPEATSVTSWGEGGDLRTWSAPRVAGFAWRARTAELRLLHAPHGPPGERALRELLALQASDWAFLAARGLAGDYPLERSQRHASAFAHALRGEQLDPALRNLAPHMVGWSS